MERIHEGMLYQNQHKRYYLYEAGVPEHKILTCTSGCRLEVWLNRAWIAGNIEGDGEDYWFFADRGGKFLLAERMKARYTEHHWRSGMRDISGICSSPSIRIMGQRSGQKHCQITQRHEILEAARLKEIKIEDFISITMTSRKTSTERRIDEVLQRLGEGDTLIVTELSRLGRNTAEIIALVNELVTRGIRLIALKQHIDLSAGEHDMLIVE